MIAIHVNGEALEFEGTTVEQLVQHLGIARQGVAIAVNASSQVADCNLPSRRT